MTTKKPSRLAREIAEMAAGQRRIGMMDEATWRRITLQHWGLNALPTAEPNTGEEVKAVREPQ